MKDRSGERSLWTSDTTELAYSFFFQPFLHTKELGRGKIGVHPRNTFETTPGAVVVYLTTQRLPPEGIPFKPFNGLL